MIGHDHVCHYTYPFVVFKVGEPLVD